MSALLRYELLKALLRIRSFQFGTETDFLLMSFRIQVRILLCEVQKISYILPVYNRRCSGMVFSYRLKSYMKGGPRQC
jgi:hypothetical protein